MHTVRFAPTTPVMQVDFPEGVKRARPGSALYLKPNKMARLTDEELAHIKKAHKDLKMEVLKPKAKAMTPPAVAKPEPKPEPKPEAKRKKATSTDG